VRLDEDGEILVRGGNVFTGYFRNDAATREAFTEDGFFRTGDVGELDRAGYLRITDRKKDLIITAGGKNVAPQEVEGRLKLDPLISQAVVIGDRRPFISALLTLDPDEAPKWAEARGIKAADPVELAGHPKVLEEVEQIVGRVNEDLSQVEKIKRWTLLPNDFTQEAEEITPTLKVRRKVVSEKYGAAIEAMYA
jgi:long-chain acyl-CoA synthetase